MLLISVASVNARTCIESTDGSVSGWLDTEDAGDNKPEGCISRSYYTGKCTEFCIDDEIFRDFSCRDRVPDATRNDDTVITLTEYPRPSRYRAEHSEIPEFGTFGVAMILVGAGLYAIRKRKNVRT